MPQLLIKTKKTMLEKLFNKTIPEHYDNVINGDKLNAQELLNYLLELNQDNDLSQIQVNFRYSDDSEVFEVSKVEEDLFDEETNNNLQSIVLKVK